MTCPDSESETGEMPWVAGAHLGGALSLFTPDFRALVGPADQVPLTVLGSLALSQAALAGIQQCLLHGRELAELRQDCVRVACRTWFGWRVCSLCLG